MNLNCLSFAFTSISKHLTLLLCLHFETSQIRLFPFIALVLAFLPSVTTPPSSRNFPVLSQKTDRAAVKVRTHVKRDGEDRVVQSSPMQWHSLSAVTSVLHLPFLPSARVSSSLMVTIRPHVLGLPSTLTTHRGKSRQVPSLRSFFKSEETILGSLPTDYPSNLLA